MNKHLVPIANAIKQIFELNASGIVAARLTPDNTGDKAIILPEIIARLISAEINFNINEPYKVVSLNINEVNQPLEFMFIDCSITYNRKKTINLPMEASKTKIELLVLNQTIHTLVNTVLQDVLRDTGFNDSRSILVTETVLGNTVNYSYDDNKLSFYQNGERIAADDIKEVLNEVITEFLL